MQVSEQYRTIVGPQQTAGVNNTNNNTGYPSGRQQRLEFFQQKKLLFSYCYSL